MDKSKFPDPFAQARQEKGYGEMNDQNDPVTMVLRHRDVRKCAHDWQRFQSGATPGRIVVPSEVNIRDTRQIPFEMDPPLHGEYRNLLEEWFKRPLNPDYEKRLKAQIQASIDTAVESDQLDVVSELALPIQSRALTLLLDVPLAEAETWIAWGTHVFRSKDDPLDGTKANLLYDYIADQIEQARQNPGNDLYSALLRSEAQGRPLTTEEITGVMILTFAGGRDTVINAVTNSIAYFAENPKALARIREEPEITGKAVEELIRYFAPLTHMGRVVTQDSQVCEHAVKADSRISLCWASANRDASVFEQPEEVILDRKMNPHLSFGFSRHKCLGATHTRQLLKVLLQVLVEKVASIDILNSRENIETLGKFNRKVGFHRLEVAFKGL